MTLRRFVFTGAESAPPTLTAEHLILTIENHDYALPATRTLSADTVLAEDVEPLMATLDSAAPAENTIVMLTGGREDRRGTPVRDTTAGRSAVAVGLGPQMDRATTNRALAAADPLRYSP